MSGVFSAAQAGFQKGKTGLHEHHQEPANQHPDDVDGVKCVDQIGISLPRLIAIQRTVGVRQGTAGALARWVTRNDSRRRGGRLRDRRPAGRKHRQQKTRRDQHQQNATPEWARKVGGHSIPFRSARLTDGWAEQGSFNRDGRKAQINHAAGLRSSGTISSVIF